MEPNICIFPKKLQFLLKEYNIEKTFWTSFWFSYDCDVQKAVFGIRLAFKEFLDGFNADSSTFNSYFKVVL